MVTVIKKITLNCISSGERRAWQHAEEHHAVAAAGALRRLLLVDATGAFGLHHQSTPHLRHVPGLPHHPALQRRCHLAHLWLQHPRLQSTGQEHITLANSHFNFKITSN